MEPRNRTLLSAAILIVLLLIAIVAASRDARVGDEGGRGSAAAESPFSGLEPPPHRSPS